MQVSVKKTKGLERELTISVPTDRIDQAFKKRVQQMAKTADLKGFRKGHVPIQHIEKQYGASLRQEILNSILQETLREAVTQENLQPAGQPKIDVKKYEPGYPLEYTVIFEIYPTLELKDMTKVTLEKITSAVTDKDIDQMVDTLRKQRSTWDKVDRAAKNDDRVMIDFEGFINDQPFEGSKAEKFPVILGSNSMIPGFEEGIVGAKADDKKDVKVKFPKDYPNKELADKAAVFKIQVHEVQQAKLPELNEEFFKQLGIQAGGLSKLKTELKKTMQRELDLTLRNLNKMDVMKKLLEINKFESPKSLVEAEINGLHYQAVQRAKQYSQSKEEPNILKDTFKEEAERRVKFGLIVAEYIKTEKIKPDPKRIRQVIEELARMYDNPEKIIKDCYANKQQLAAVEMMVAEDLVVDKLLESAKVKETSISYEEAMKRRMRQAA